MDHESTPDYETKEARWEAIVRRDPRADGAFVYGVVTTGVYCRPHCPSRLPNRENVRTFATSEEAEAAGYRPCKRCAPDAPAQQEPQREAVVRACRIIERAETPPTLAQLAADVGLSPSHLHRTFKRIVGVTPKQYAMERRGQRVRERLRNSDRVSDAIYEAGFAASSRFYEGVAARLGMSPSAYRNGAADVHIRSAVARCDLGWVLVAATEAGVCAIDLGDGPKALVRRLHDRFPEAEIVDQDPQVAGWVEDVLAYLGAPGDGLDLPLDIRGTAFQRRVWDALREIPPGTTTSYGAVAAQIGQPGAARAVAQACAKNPVALAIPCHRVLRGDGDLGGYRWGTERKRALLERERRTRASEEKQRTSPRSEP
jgi:AraC family transcriptional regulator of adaptative response/methylated-DNA-[protein]-cysteine methyltransferase